MFFSSINPNIFLAIFYIVFGLKLLLMMMVVVAAYLLNQKNKKNSTFLSYTIKFLSIKALLITTVLTIPFFNIFIGTIYCTNSSPIA